MMPLRRGHVNAGRVREVLEGRSAGGRGDGGSSANHQNLFLCKCPATVDVSTPRYVVLISVFEGLIYVVHRKNLLYFGTNIFRR